MRWREPLLIPFFAVAAGITAGQYIPFSTVESLAAACAISLTTCFAPRLRRFGMSCALVFAGIAATAVRAGSAPPTLSVPDNVPVILAGCVVDPALVAADRERFTVELAPGARAQVSLFARPEASFPALPYGTRIEFEGKVRIPHNFKNPGAFDAVHYFARQRIFWNASGDAATVRVMPGRCGNRVAGLIFAIRSAALTRLDDLYANDPYTDGMMQAVLIGATAKLDRLWTEDYRSTGTFHALVISGGHVAVLAAVLLFFLRICAVPGGVALTLTVLAAWLYAGVTGWQAPVLRSAAGMSLYAIARCFYRDGRMLNLLAAVALLFVAFDSEQLADAGFQLSFLAVAIIAAFVVPVLDSTSGPLTRGLRDLSETGKDIRLDPKTAQFRIELRLLSATLTALFRLPARIANSIVTMAARITLYIWEIFTTSFFIQVGLALPMIAYFHRLSVSGLSANAIVVPVLSAVVPLGFLAIAFQSHVLAGACARLLALSKWAVGLHARWEPDWRIPAPPAWLGGLFVLALVVAALRMRRLWPRAIAWTCASVALATIILHPFAPVLDRGKFEMSAIDVGQGDSLLTAFPDGKLMLVDAGGIPSFGRVRKANLDIGEDVVSPYLWTRSIRRLDVVVMTHAHEDHMGGMVAVLRNFRPRELWTGAVQESPEWIRVRDAARQFGVAIRPMQRMAPFAYGGSTIHVLAPDPDYISGPQPKNDDSLVMRVKFGSTSFLLTGDMEKRIEEQLFYEGLLEHSDVLKVGHHGSRTSSTRDLLDAVHPAFGIISAGFENSYGHPHPATVEALTTRHIGVYRTDERGLVQVLSDGKRIEIRAPGY